MSVMSPDATYYSSILCYLLRCLLHTLFIFFFFSSRRRHTRLQGDWSSDVCSSDLTEAAKHRDERCPRHLRPLLHPVVRGKRGATNRAGQDPVRPRGSVRGPTSKIGRASCRERV